MKLAIPVRHASRGRPVAAGAEGFRSRGWGEIAAANCVLLAAAAVIYQPWRFEPLEVMDFSEFLPLVHGGGFWRGVIRLTRYYAEQGRFNGVAYLLISLNSQLSHLDPIGWHWGRFVQMAVVVVGVYVTLRRMSGTAMGSLLGASLFVVAGTAAGAWNRQTSEPAGTLCLLAALLCADRFREGRAGIGGILVAILGMLLCKETFVACVPFILAVALIPSASEPGRSPAAFNASRAVPLIVGVAVLLLAVGGLSLFLRGIQRPDAYAGLYGTGVLSMDVVLTRLLFVLLPVWTQTDQPLLLAIVPSNLVFLVLLVAGLGAVAIVTAERRRRLFRAVTLCGLLLLCGVAIYLPWPRFEPFYGLPFLFGPALVVATMFGEIVRSDRWRVVWVTSWVGLSVAAALTAFSVTRATEARRVVNWQVARWLATHTGAEPTIVATNNLTPQAWQNPGATLARYAAAIGLSPRPVRVTDVDCATARQQLASRSISSAVIYFVDACGMPERSDLQLQWPISYFDWRALAMRVHFSRANVILPESPRIDP